MDGETDHTMEPVISYLDTTIGCVSFNVTPAASREVIDALTRANEARKAKRGHEERMAYALAVAHILEERHFPLIVHEWSHVLQAIAYPALYVRCLRELNFTLEVVRLLRRSREEIPIPIPISSGWLASLEASVQPYRVTIGDGGPAIDPPDPTMPMPNDLTETDLVEDAASIFQYKVEVGEPGSADDYRRWLNSDYRYSKTFELTSGLLGPDDAFIALPCLVMAAHMTNWPVNGFVALLEATAKTPGLPGLLGTDGYWNALTIMVSDSGIPMRAPDPAAHVGIEDEQHGIDEEAVLGLIDRWPEHPLTPLVAATWRDAAALGRLRNGLLHPYLLFNGGTRRAADWLNQFLPPMMTFRLLSPEMTIGDTVGFISPWLQEQPNPVAPGLDWFNYTTELLRAKAFAFAAATPFGAHRRHNCPHTDCDFHDSDLCSRWSFVPASYRDCNFPDWLETATGRRVDLDAQRFVSPTESEAGDGTGAGPHRRGQR